MQHFDSHPFLIVVSVRLGRAGSAEVAAMQKGGPNDANCQSPYKNWQSKQKSDSSCLSQEAPKVTEVSVRLGNKQLGAMVG